MTLSFCFRNKFLLLCIFRKNVVILRAKLPKYEEMKKGQLTTLEWFIVGVVVAAVLLVTLCIILPPPGEVDDSVISCLWILLAFDSILAVVFCIHKGIDAKFEKGDMSITLNNPEPNAAGA